MGANFNRKYGHGVTDSLLNRSEFEQRGAVIEPRTKKVGLDPNMVNSLVNKLNRDIQELQEQDGSHNLPSFLNETDLRSSVLESEAERLEFYLNPEDRQYERDSTANRYREKQTSSFPHRGNTFDSLAYRQEESDLNSNFTRLFSSDMKQTPSQDFNWPRHPQKGTRVSSHYQKDTYSHPSRDHANQRFDPYLTGGKEDRMRKVVDLQSSLDDHDKRFYPEPKNTAPKSHQAQRNGHGSQVNNRILESPSPDNNNTASFHISSEFGSGFSLDPHNKDSSYTNFRDKDYITSTPNESILNSKIPTSKLSHDTNSRGESVFNSNHFDRDSHSKNHVGFNLKKNQMFTRSPSLSSVPWKMDSDSFTPLKPGLTKTKSPNKNPNTVDPDAYNAIGSSNFSQPLGPEETHQRWDSTKNQRLPRELSENDGFKPQEKHNNNFTSLMSEGFSIDDQSLDNDSPFVSHRSLMGLPSSQNGTKLKGSLKALRAKISRLEIDKLTSEQRIKHLEALLRRARHVSDQSSGSANPSTNLEGASGNRTRWSSSKNNRPDLPVHENGRHTSLDVSLGDGGNMISPLNKQENQKYLRKLVAENQRIKQELGLLTHQLDNVMPVILKLNLETEKSESGNTKNYEKAQANARDDLTPSKSKPKTSNFDSFQTSRSETRSHHSKRNDYVPDRLESPGVSKTTFSRSNTQQNRHEHSASNQKDLESVSGLPSRKQDKSTQHKSTEAQRSPSRILTPSQSYNTYHTLLQSKRKDKGIGNPSPSYNLVHRESTSSSHSSPSLNSSLTGDEISTHKPPELRNGFQSPTSTLTSSEKGDQDEVETLWESLPPSRSRTCNKMDPPNEPSAAPRKAKIPGLINDDPSYPTKKQLVTSSILKEAIDLIRSRTDYDRASKILTTARSEKCMQLSIENVPIPPTSSPLPEVTIQLIDSVVVTLQEEYHVCKKRYEEYMEKLKLSKPSMNSSPTRVRRNSPQDQLIPEISAVLKEMEVKMDQIHLLQQVQGQFFRKL